MSQHTTELFDEHGIVAHLRDGRVMAWSRFGRYCDFDVDGQFDNWYQRLPDLKYVERVIQVQFDYGEAGDTSDKVQEIDGMDCKINIYEGVGKSYIGNVVGMTLLGAAKNVTGGTITQKAFGTSVYVDIVAIGPP